MGRKKRNISIYSFLLRNPLIVRALRNQYFTFKVNVHSKAHLSNMYSITCSWYDHYSTVSRYLHSWPCGHGNTIPTNQCKNVDQKNNPEKVLQILHSKSMYIKHFGRQAIRCNECVSTNSKYCNTSLEAYLMSHKYLTT